MRLNIAAVAKVTHEVNRAYCQALGDDSQASWESAPTWQRDSAIAGVRAVLDGSANTPEEQHERWAAHKLADGWVYGEIKDADAKTHPCLVAYSDLPPAQRAKGFLFRAVVEALR
jgi:hypothetical protein